MLERGSIRRLPIARAALPAVLALMLGSTAYLSAQAAAPAETGEDIRGPKALVEIPQPPKPNIRLWLGLGGAAILLTAAAALWLRHARRKHLKSPPEIALASLAELEASPEMMVAEAFANRAAQTIRQYIAERFGLAAPRRTTEEFLRDLASATASPLSAESDHLRTFLRACDLAKFAALHLDGSQRVELLQAARGFVNVTATATLPPTAKPRPVTP